MWTQLVQTALTLVLFKFMINSAAQTANGQA